MLVNASTAFVSHPKHRSKFLAQVFVARVSLMELPDQILAREKNHFQAFVEGVKFYGAPFYQVFEPHGLHSSAADGITLITSYLPLRERQVLLAADSLPENFRLLGICERGTPAEQFVQKAPQCPVIYRLVVSPRENQLRCQVVWCPAQREGLLLEDVILLEWDTLREPEVDDLAKCLRKAQEGVAISCGLRWSGHQGLKKPIKDMTNQPRIWSRAATSKNSIERSNPKSDQSLCC